MRYPVLERNKNFQILPTLDCPFSNGNEAPHSKFERPNGKTQNPKKKLNWSRIALTEKGTT